jgi:hypothetical protein
MKAPRSGWSGRSFGRQRRERIHIPPACLSARMSAAVELGVAGSSVRALAPPDPVDTHIGTVENSGGIADCCNRSSGGSKLDAVTKRRRDAMAEVMRHPVRVRLVEACVARDRLSPTEFVDQGIGADLESMLGKTPKGQLSQVAYRCRQLEKVGYLAVVAERPVRGARLPPRSAYVGIAVERMEVVPGVDRVGAELLGPPSRPRPSGRSRLAAAGSGHRCGSARRDSLIDGTGEASNLGGAYVGSAGRCLRKRKPRGCGAFVTAQTQLLLRPAGR